MSWKKKAGTCSDLKFILSDQAQIPAKKGHISLLQCDRGTDVRHLPENVTPHPSSSHLGPGTDN